MAVNLCGCTAPRCFTPTPPIIKRKFKAPKAISDGSENHRISAIPEEVPTDSRYTSARTEELREIRGLFRSSEDDHDAEKTGNHDASSVNSKHSKIASFFRRHLSRTFSKSKLDDFTDPDKLKDAKKEIRANLLNENGPDEGGYDEDAPEIEHVDDTLNTGMIRGGDGEISLEQRGRNNGRRHSMHHSTWSGPSRLSIDFSPPRLSFGSHGYHRRSYSMGSFGGLDTPEPPMRLPSFSGERETSYTWKKGVMDSLQIQSPSTANLVHTPIRRAGTRSKRESSFINWPLREAVLTPDSEKALLPKSPTLDPKAFSPEPPAGETSDATQAVARPSEDAALLTVPKPSIDLVVAKSAHENCSSSGGGHPHFFGRPERRPPRSSSHSVHLYNMNISRQLRSTSLMTGSSFPMSRPTTRPPTATASRASTPAAETVPAMPNAHLAIEDLPPLPPSATKTCASSEYSADQTASPAGSRVAKILNHPITKAVAEKCRPSVHEATPSKVRTYPQDAVVCYQEQSAAGQNASTSNLSQHSQNSSKVSRFKEEFDSPGKTKNKRRSFVNMFGQLKNRKRNQSAGSLDGTINEPKRLQRAMALTEQKDAAGLLAKAIRDKQAEKAALYLKPNKDLAAREVFRQRSSSFCRPRGDSLAAEGAAGPSTRGDWHRRSTSETFLRPDASMPTLQPPPAAVPRAYSTGHLTPEFTTPVFSGSSFLTPEGGRSPGRTMSISVDPSAISPSRRGSFQPDISPSRRGSFQPSTPTVPESGSYDTSVAAGKRASAIDIDDRPFTSDSDASLGAWSRYPSHTREARTGSAGGADDVLTRDFAYISNPSAIVESSDIEDQDKSTKKGKAKSKRRTGKIPQSRSMILGGLKNYAKMFTRSSSTEFMSGGKGHRSSISAGGILEHPELELLPPVFAPMPVIPDNRDPALEPDQGEMELKKLSHRRADHGGSFKEPSSHVHSRHGKMGMDGSSEYTSAQEARRVASSPALVGTLTAPDGSLIRNALTYARFYESCVHLPLPSSSHGAGPNSSEAYSFGSNSIAAYRNKCITASNPSSPTTQQIIDKILGSPPGSRSVSPLPSPLLQLERSIAEIASGRVRGHVSSKSGSSSRSAPLRASSMDLIKTLKAAEERELRELMERRASSQLGG